MTRSQGRDRPGFGHAHSQKEGKKKNGARNKSRAFLHATYVTYPLRDKREFKKMLRKSPKLLTCLSVLVCPEGAEAEMIPLARRWDLSVTDIYQRRLPITSSDVLRHGVGFQIGQMQFH